MRLLTVMGKGISCFLAAVVLTTPAWPQASTATVSGTVRDQSAAVVPTASVTLSNTATGVSSTTLTNTTGFYIFAGVVPGPYNLLVEAPGMQKFEGKLTVQVQQSAVVDAVLKLGQTATEVTVRDVTPIVTVDNPTLSHVLERERIEQLPVNGRFITELLQTVPGLEQETEYDSVSTRAFGMRRGSTEFVLDGASTTDRLMGGVFRRPAGLDTIQEFKVETNVSSAKLARPATVIMSTKSGTNQLHGSAFETHRNNGIGKARTRTDFYEKPPQLIRNEFGVSAGAPVFLPKLYNGKNRTFWFFAYEAHRNMTASTQGYSLPTPAMRNGDFRGLIDSQGRQLKIYDPWTTNPQTWERQQISYNGQLNVIDPNRISPLMKYLLEITPLPTLANVNPLVAPNFFGPQPNRRRDWTVTTRIDHRFSENDQFYGRYTQGKYHLFRQFYTFVALNDVGGTVTRTAPNKAAAASWVHTFSPTFFNEVLVSGSTETWRSGTGDPNTRWSDQLGIPNPNNVAGWPALYSHGLDMDFETENTQTTPFAFYIIDDNATKIVGRHELQFGFHYRWDKLDTLPEQQYTQGQANGSSIFTSLYDPSTSPNNPLPTQQTGYNLASSYLGLMNYYVQLGHPLFKMRAQEYAFYFQDNFKVNSRLTLNLGLRYDYWPANREISNLLTSFDPAKRAIVLGSDLETMYRLGATLPSVVERMQSLGVKFIGYEEAGLPKSLYKVPKTNFGPRAGFAYRFGGNDRSMVLRGGYRISHFTIPLRAWTAQQRSNAPYYARLTSNINDSALSPDGIANYYMRSVPAIVAGVNSRDAISLSNVSSIVRGSPFASYFARNQPDTRVHDWNLTLEKEVMPNTVVRASYVGNHTSNLELLYDYNGATPEYIWYVTKRERLPTGEYANVARRFYDQTVYGTVQEYRKSGWGNFSGMTLEAERRYSGGYGFQLFYSVGNALEAGGEQWRIRVPEVNSYLPGAVPADFHERARLLHYRRDADVPKHRLRWNWIADLPFGRGKALGRNSGGILDKVIGGWQIAGMGSLRSTYFALPTGVYPTGEKVELYGYQYPIEDCRSGACRPGYLWWNGYIPASRINSHDASGRPNGIMGVPDNYKPAAQPLIPWGSTVLPPNAPANTNVASFWDTNTVWIPLENGTVQRTTFNDNLHPWQNQYLPSVRQWGLDASLFKTIAFGEQFRVRFNADFFNVLNAPGNPNSVGSNGVLNTFNSGQPARELQLTLRLTW
ncbi:MAG: TonB-dependent receptor [Bryobacteraceae bacterium]|nr:TonB-dependent receptor [Bryobacterales bacterium]MEB2363811.1 TonB-dependent receptor [Bryobacterales bacterium]NUN02760.1 TonB-dependent receptor [Bryobacteraceae bacterium]